MTVVNGQTLRIHLSVESFAPLLTSKPPSSQPRSCLCIPRADDDMRLPSGCADLGESESGSGPGRGPRPRTSSPTTPRVFLPPHPISGDSSFPAAGAETSPVVATQQWDWVAYAPGAAVSIADVVPGLAALSVGHHLMPHHPPTPVFMPSPPQASHDVRPHTMSGVPMFRSTASVSMTPPAAYPLPPRPVTRSGASFSYPLPTPRFMVASAPLFDWPALDPGPPLVTPHPSVTTIGAEDMLETADFGFALAPFASSFGDGGVPFLRLDPGAFPEDRLAGEAHASGSHPEGPRPSAEAATAASPRTRPARQDVLDARQATDTNRSTTSPSASTAAATMLLAASPSDPSPLAMGSAAQSAGPTADEQQQRQEQPQEQPQEQEQQQQQQPQEQPQQKQDQQDQQDQQHQPQVARVINTGPTRRVLSIHKTSHSIHTIPLAPPHTAHSSAASPPSPFSTTTARIHDPPSSSPSSSPGAVPSYLLHVLEPHRTLTASTPSMALGTTTNGWPHISPLNQHTSPHTAGLSTVYHPSTFSSTTQIINPQTSPSASSSSPQQIVPPPTQFVSPSADATIPTSAVFATSLPSFATAVSPIADHQHQPPVHASHQQQSSQTTAALLVSPSLPTAAACTSENPTTVVPPRPSLLVGAHHYQVYPGWTDNIVAPVVAPYAPVGSYDTPISLSPPSPNVRPEQPTTEWFYPSPTFSSPEWDADTELTRKPRANLSYHLRGNMQSNGGRLKEPVLQPGETLATKPSASYAALIGEALLLAPPPHQLYVSEISDSIKARYAYYRQNPSKIYNGVRHQTSMCEAFVKLQRPFGDQSGGARKWAIRDGCQDWFRGGGYHPSPKGGKGGKKDGTGGSSGIVNPRKGSKNKEAITGRKSDSPPSPTYSSGGLGPSAGRPWDPTKTPHPYSIDCPPYLAHQANSYRASVQHQAIQHAHAQLAHMGHQVKHEPAMTPPLGYSPSHSGSRNHQQLVTYPIQQPQPQGHYSSYPPHAESYPYNNIVHTYTGTSSWTSTYPSLPAPGSSGSSYYDTMQSTAQWRQSVSAGPGAMVSPGVCSSPVAGTSVFGDIGRGPPSRGGSGGGTAAYAGSIDDGHAHNGYQSSLTHSALHGDFRLGSSQDAGPASCEYYPNASSSPLTDLSHADDD